MTAVYPARAPRGPPLDTTCVPSAGVTFEFVSAPGGRHYSPMPFAARLGRGDSTDSTHYVPGDVLRLLSYPGGGLLLPNNGIYSIGPGAPLPVTVAFLDTLNLATFEFARNRVNLVLPPAPAHSLWTVQILLEQARTEEERRKDWFINRVLTGAARTPSGDSMFVDVFAGKPEAHILVY